MVEAYEREPGWWLLIPAFAAHAAGEPALLARLHAARERFLAAVAELIEAVAERHGLAYRLPALEIARGSGAFMRGMAFEWLVDPSAERRESFEELAAAYMRGLEL